MNGIKKLDITDSEYPEILKLIKDPPTSLYYSGNIELLSNRCISIVGARKATEYGLETAEEMGRKTGEAGLTVVSGMADGIDTAAHRGAINTAGGTIAVLGCGIDMETGERRKRALDRIRSSGLVISEYPNGYPASKYTFPRRNRIISGLSAATVVVEAGFNSGSLITAELAAEQGRCVYAVPGNIDSGMSLGTNKLIKDGAVPVVSINDILIDAGVYNNEETNLHTWQYGLDRYPGTGCHRTASRPLRSLLPHRQQPRDGVGSAGPEVPSGSRGHSQRGQIR